MFQLDKRDGGEDQTNVIEDSDVYIESISAEQ